MGNTYNPQSQSGRGFNGLPAPFGGGEHVDPYIVARVLPRTSKGITDLLLLSLLRLDAADPSKKILRRTPLAEPQRARQDEDPEHRRRAGPKLNRAARAPCEEIATERRDEDDERRRIPPHHHRRAMIAETAADVEDLPPRTRTARHAPRSSSDDSDATAKERRRVEATPARKPRGWKPVLGVDPPTS